MGRKETNIYTYSVEKKPVGGNGNERLTSLAGISLIKLHAGCVEQQRSQLMLTNIQIQTIFLNCTKRIKIIAKVLL